MRTAKANELNLGTVTVVNFSAAARILGVSKPTVARWAQSGKLAPVDIVAGGGRYVTAESVAAVLESKGASA